MITRNQLNVLNNIYQKDFHKVLCVCSAGCLRSPTAAVVLAQEPYNFNTRSAGAEQEFAIVPVTEALLTWANEIVCMENTHAYTIRSLLDTFGLTRPIKILDIPDIFEYRDPKLMKLIATSYDEVTND